MARGEFRQGRVACGGCGKNFSDPSAIQKHFSGDVCGSGQRFVVKLNAVVHKCLYCEKTFVSKLTLKRHLRSDHNSAGGSLLCPYCGSRWRCKAVLEVHIRRQHTGVRPYHCQTCQVSFTDKNSLTRHLSTTKHLKAAVQLSHKTSLSQSGLDEGGGGVEVSSPWAMYCDACNYGTNQKSHYKKHVNSNVHRRRVSGSHDREEVRGVALTCSYCKTTKYGQESLTRHMRKHFPTKSVKCGVCDKTYSSKILLQEHIVKTHPQLSQGRILVCDLCQFRTVLLHRLLRHQNSAHNGTELPYKCPRPNCSRTFTFKSLVNIHVRRHHDKVAVPSSIKGPMLTCDFCTFRTSVKSSLYRHLRVHAGSKPYR